MVGLHGNSNVHLHNFLTKCDIIKLNGVSTDTIRLSLFLFSLRNRASDWMQNEEANSFTTWEALSKVFLSKYFLPGKTAKLSTDIIPSPSRIELSLIHI